PSEEAVQTRPMQISASRSMRRSCEELLAEWRREVEITQESYRSLHWVTLTNVTIGGCFPKVLNLTPSGQFHRESKTTQAAHFIRFNRKCVQHREAWFVKPGS